ncbi:EAL domain-containing protein [Desulfovibrio aminophilus]|nr:EAL domain-containing protein [Desulfovibrio aminophilus]
MTEARRTAKALEQSEGTLRAVFNNVHSAVFLHGPDGTILDVNDRMLELFGVTRAEARRMSIASDFSGPEADVGHLPEIWRKVMSGKALTFDWKSRRPGDDKLFDVEVHLRRVDLPAGPRILATVMDITDRKQALAALTESEARYRSLFEKGNDCIALIRGGRIVECNQRAEEVLGVPRERILGTPAGGFTPEYQPCGRRSSEMAAEQQTRAAAGENLFFEWRQLRADGSEFDAEVSLSLVDPGPPALLQAIMRDISERKQALAAITESEARYRTLARNFPNGTVLLFDTEMRFLLAGGLGLEALGLKPEDIVGRTPGEFFPPDMAPRVEEVFRQALAGQTSLSELAFADRFYEVRTVPVTGAGGRITGGMAVSQDISARKRLEEQLRHQALHDPLTGLANRTLCLDRIRQAVERSRRRPGYNFAVIFVDLDRFKLVNDSMGHKFGDTLLVETGSRLLECVRDLDTVARLGGDEFVLVLEELEAPRRAIQVVRRVREVLGREFQLGQRVVQLTASIGVVVDTRHYRAPEDVLQNANLAMHRAKEMGRDRFKVFTNRMLDAAVHRLNLESGLQRALAESQLFLVFQPIVRLGRDYGLYGFEALVRWRHPDRGVVGPSEFIPIAEESGLIVELGLWVLRAACRTFAQWLGSVREASELTLSVNLSGRQFAQADLVNSIRRVLQETGMPANQLKLEITETALMENASRAAERLQALRDLGIRLSVDDFGTGYSNMIYLQQLPLDLLKIDLSFIQKMDVNRENVEIVKAIISLAHTLGLEVVAEGVERSRHHEILGLLDCEFGQGYLYSPPLAEPDARTFIREFRDRPLPA